VISIAPPLSASGSQNSEKKQNDELEVDFQRHLSGSQLFLEQVVVLLDPYPGTKLRRSCIRLASGSTEL
jgi:hypothetical protein